MFRKLYCARCGKEIKGQAMTEKINGRYVKTDRECHAYLKAKAGKATLDDMIHEALDKGPGTALAKKRRYHD